jgi:hypothetical protein
MKNLLIKMAYKILEYYGLETMPVLYFNGTKYYTRSVDLHINPDDVNTVTVIGQDEKI